jgi:hypothetical protein
MKEHDKRLARATAKAVVGIQNQGFRPDEITGVLMVVIGSLVARQGLNKTHFLGEMSKCFDNGSGPQSGYDHAARVATE